MIIEVDPQWLTISANGRAERLTRSRFLIAQYLIERRPGIALRRGIEWTLWGERRVEHPKAAVDVFMVDVRAAFQRLGFHVVNERGLGWRLVEGERE